MAANTKAPVLVVLQLSGGNDGLNTVIPYSNPLYYDSFIESSSNPPPRSKARA